MEKETQRLIDEAIAKTTPAESTETVEKPSSQIDVTFQRLQSRIDDLLSTIEDALKAVGPNLDVKTEEIVASLAKQLGTAGLGVFATRAARIVKDELESKLSIDAIFTPVYEVIEKNRITITDAIEKTAKGAVRNVGQSTGDLQGKLLQMYTRLSEMDKQLETTRGEVRKWRGKSSELEERMRQREDLMSQSSEEMVRMHDSIKDLNAKLQERDNIISQLKGELGQAQSQAEQQKEMLKALDSVEQVATDYESKVFELSQVQGQLAQVNEQLGQKAAELSALRSDLEQLKQEKAAADSQMIEMSDKLASLTGSERDYQAEIDELNAKVAELQARWDTLYRVAEDDPTFKAYFLVADKTQWFQLPHLSSALGVPTVLLKRNLQKFVDAGLLEIEGDRVRPRSLSDLVADVESSEETLIENARAESDGSETEPSDPKDLTIPTPEYTGPDKGDDYEQEGR
jgi:predicted nuclease with TOPRIM domain